MNRNLDGLYPNEEDIDKFYEQEGLCACCGETLTFKNAFKKREWDCHHLNGDEEDNRNDNLAVMHRDCHLDIIHFLKYTNTYRMKKRYIPNTYKKILNFKRLPIDIFKNITPENLLKYYDII